MILFFAMLFGACFNSSYKCDSTNVDCSGGALTLRPQRSLQNQLTQQSMNPLNREQVSPANLRGARTTIAAAYH